MTECCTGTRDGGQIKVVLLPKKKKKKVVLHRTNEKTIKNFFLKQEKTIKNGENFMWPSGQLRICMALYTFGLSGMWEITYYLKIRKAMFIC